MAKTLTAFILGIVVIAAYALRQTLQQAGFPFDPYMGALFGLPIILIILKKFSFSDLGFRLGKPASGLFFVFLLPTILYLRWYFIGLGFRIPENYFPLIFIGSVAEEFFFRGYLQSEFKKSFGTLGSFFITNVLFALVHLVKGYSLAATAMTGLIGLYFSVTRDKQGGDSLFYSMGSHSLYNLVATAV